MPAVEVIVAAMVPRPQGAPTGGKNTKGTVMAVPLCFTLWLLQYRGFSRPFQREYSAYDEQYH